MLLLFHIYKYFITGEHKSRDHGLFADIMLLAECLMCVITSTDVSLNNDHGLFLMKIRSSPDESSDFFGVINDAYSYVSTKKKNYILKTFIMKILNS